MLYNRNNNVHFQQPSELSPPCFDEQACANAQPVQPIPSGRIPAFVQRLRRARSVINAKTRTFAIVIIAGLAFGALGGTLLVNQQPPHVDEASVFAERAAEAADEAQAASELNAAPAEASFTENQVRPQRRYRRVQMPAPRRAYRVATLEE